MKSNFVIYGAQSVAYSAYRMIKEIDGRVPDFFVVTSMSGTDKAGNSRKIEDISVYTIDEKDLTQKEVIVAVPENIFKEIVPELEKRGIQRIRLFDSAVFEEYADQFFYKKGLQVLKKFEMGEEQPETKIFRVFSHKDFEIEAQYETDVEIYNIQAGAALTDKKSSLTDDTGDNISLKNVNYSELSALYWIWKNADADYLGLYHYRRVLNINRDDLKRMKKNKIDVVLPYPVLIYPDISAHHNRCIKDQDWKVLLEVIKDKEPDYYREMEKIYRGQMLLNFNILVAEKLVFYNFCQWMFGILAEVEKRSIPRGSERADRYLGFMGENLTTLYFLYNYERLNIAFTGRYILI